MALEVRELRVRMVEERNAKKWQIRGKTFYSWNNQELRQLYFGEDHSKCGARIFQKWTAVTQELRDDLNNAGSRSKNNNNNKDNSKNVTWREEGEFSGSCCENLWNPLPHHLAQEHPAVGRKANVIRRHEGEQQPPGRARLSSEQNEKECSGRIRYGALLTVPLVSTGCMFAEAVERWRKLQSRGIIYRWFAETRKQRPGSLSFPVGWPELA